MKNQLGQGRPDYLPIPKTPFEMLSKSGWERLIKAIWPSQNVIGKNGVQVVRGDRNTIVELDPAIYDAIVNSGLLEPGGITTSTSSLPFQVTISGSTFDCTAGFVEVRRRFADTQPFESPLGETFIICPVDTVQQLTEVPAISSQSISTATDAIWLKITHDLTVSNGAPVIETISYTGNPTTIWETDLTDYIVEMYPLCSSSGIQYQFNNISGQQVPRFMGTYSASTFYYPGDIVTAGAFGTARTFIQVASVFGVGYVDAACWNCDPLSAVPSEAACWREIHTT